jgi:UDP-3-O-[3-hydroxymyristoyl] glucosamine N-acyltransferase
MGISLSPMEKTASELAQLLGGTVSGDPDVKVSKLGKIESATYGELTFLANYKYEKFIYESEASIAVVGKDWEPSSDLPENLTLIKVDDAYGAFAILLKAYEQVNKRQDVIHHSAIIHEGATLGKECHIGAGVVVEEGAVVGANSEIGVSCYLGKNTKLGEGCQLFSGVRILDNCVVGSGCIIQSNTVIGSEGFGFAPKEDGSFSKVPQIGNVIIEDNCDIGANCAIDRATLGSTIIQKGCKLDNLIQVAHNVVIGEKSVIAAQTGIAGSTIIGKNCLVGGQVGFVGHIKIADGTKIGAKTGVSKNVMTPDTIIQGIPAMPIKTYHKFQVGLRILVKQYFNNKDQSSK